jgi:hypothetical protein
MYILRISFNIYTPLCSSHSRDSNAPNYASIERVLADIYSIYYASTTAIKTNRFWKKRDHGQKWLVLMAGELA